MKCVFKHKMFDLKIKTMSDVVGRGGETQI